MYRRKMFGKLMIAVLNLQYNETVQSYKYYGCNEE